MFRSRFIRNHVIICGLGQKGLLLVQRFCERGEQVIVVELDEQNDFLEQCKDIGAIVLIGDATDYEILHKIHVERAKYLFSVCGDDGINAEVAVHVREIVCRHKSKVLTCIIHIVDPHLCLLLKERELGTATIDTFRLEFFNIFDSGARCWLQEYPVFLSIENSQELQNYHFLVIGVGQMGESLIEHLARKWKLLHASTGNCLRITIIDKEADQKKELLLLRFPQIAKLCELTALQIDVNSADYERANFLYDNRGNCDISHIFVCLDNDSLSLSSALVLHNRLKEHKIPIMVRMIRDAGLAKLLHGVDEKEGSFSTLQAFGLLDRTCKPDLLFEGMHEILARAMHEEYIRNQKIEGQTPQTNPSMLPWDDLPEDLKESNRRQADHIGLKLKAINCGIGPLTDWDAELFKFTPEEIEIMAEMEHERWVADRIQEGWIYAEGEKNLTEKTTQFLISWDKLPEDIRQYDRHTVQAIPSFLAQVDCQIYRLKQRN